MILYKLIENNSSNIKSIFSNTIWQKYSITFDLLDHNMRTIIVSPQFKQFDIEVRDFFHNVNLLQVLIYTKYNELLFSLNTTHERQHNDYVIYQSTDKIIEDETGDITAILPISSDKFSKFPEAVMELKYNSSAMAEYINSIYVSYFVTIAILTVVILSIIYYILLVNRKALNQQYKINLKLKMAKESAEENNLKKSIFLASVSHELKTPLNSIIGFSQLLKEDSTINVNKYQEYVNDIYNSGVHLLSLINDILDFSKTEVNKLSIHNSLFDLNKVLESCVRMVNPRAKKYYVTIKVQAPDEPTIITADARRMKQVLLNLLSNSLKFTKEQGQIIIMISKKAEHIILTIEDTGIGIAEKDLAKAMSSFGQADNELSRKYEGTGLGLPLSKRLVELMGGTFNIKSKKEHGTIVTLRFFAHNSH